MYRPLGRGTHNLSHSVKSTQNMGWITPIANFDVVPGDKINHKISALIRTQPLLAPVMHLVDIDVHVYYAPNRILWEGAEDFYSGGDDGMAVVEAPYMMSPAMTGYAVGSLADHLGIPTGVPDLKHSALPIRMYNYVYNTAYRDSQLQAEIPWVKTNGLDATTPRNLLAPCWKRDYFTKCRPYPQLGPDVVIPIIGDGAVVGNGKALGFYDGTQETGLGQDGSHNMAVRTSMLNDPVGAPFDNTGAGVGGKVLGISENPANSGLVVNDGAIGIREQREGNAVMRYLEANNIFGGRYIEQMMARFGVRIPDYRIDFPEYIGSGSTKIQFSEVLQTANNVVDDESDESVGTLRGHGISLMASNRYKRVIPEYGWIQVYMIIRPKTQYAQGLHRSMSRETKYDYLVPEFQDIGDQPVLKKELYAASATPNAVLGYTPQYEEYRTIPSRIAGEFKSTLDYWTMCRLFGTEPSLNSSFVTCNPTDRIFPTEVRVADSLQVTATHDIIARRPLRVQPDYRLM